MIGTKVSLCWAFWRRRVRVSITVGWMSAILTVISASGALEGPFEVFLGESSPTTSRVFDSDRFPNIIVAMDGSVLAFWNGVKLRRSEDGGQSWGEPIAVGEGFMGGGVTVNEGNGEIFAFVEANHPPADLVVYRSRDHGKAWETFETKVMADSLGHVPSMHMNEHGISLRHGRHAGRLLRPTRWYAGKNDRTRWPEHYTNAIYSDDGGKTWQTSAPFPAKGTGEAAVAELSDGILYYNSRRHWAPEGEDPRRRWTARSGDGGNTWEDLQICEVLPDGPQDTNYGCMAGLTRLPVEGRDVLLYSNADSPSGRRHGTVWASFDGGRTWPMKRLVTEESFAYSSMTAGRPGTTSEGWIYLMYESEGAKVARFNLSWVLEGEMTGDGAVPEWVAL